MAQRGRFVGRVAIWGQAAFLMIFSTLPLETSNPVLKRDQMVHVDPRADLDQQVCGVNLDRLVSLRWSPRRNQFGIVFTRLPFLY
jgi:hypothetical protein